MDAAIKDAAGSTPSQPTDAKYNLVTKAQFNAAQLAATQQMPAQQIPAQQVLTPQVPMQQVLTQQAPVHQALTQQAPLQPLQPPSAPQQPSPQTSTQQPSVQEAVAMNMMQGFTNPMVDTQAMAAFDMGHGWQPCVDEIGNDGYNHNPQVDYTFGDPYFR